MDKTKIPARFAEKIVFEEGACWTWIASKTANGYGQVAFNGKSSYRAHRAVYELLVGPIPKGLDIDHLCRNRACVNPAHMEPVTRKENVLRGIGLTAAHAKKTHCPRGHEYTESNIYRTPKKPNQRLCRTCRKTPFTRSI